MFSPRNKDQSPAVYEQKQGQFASDALMTNVSVRRTRPRQRPNRFLFRAAFARARPCYCYGCICLTKDERAYERRVFRLARAWGRILKHERQRLAQERATAEPSNRPL